MGDTVARAAREFVNRFAPIRDDRDALARNSLVEFRQFLTDHGGEETAGQTEDGSEVSPAGLVWLAFRREGGDLVETAEHDGRDGNGTYFWNLITRNGQNAVSGIYLFSVEHPEGVCRGRFVIIR